MTNKNASFPHGVAARQIHIKYFLIAFVNAYQKVQLESEICINEAVGSFLFFNFVLIWFLTTYGAAIIIIMKIIICLNINLITNVSYDYWN